MPFSPPVIRFFFIPFQADRWSNIAQISNFFDGGFIQKPSVGEDMEERLRMSFANIEEVVSEKRLSSENDNQMDSHLLGFINDAVYLLAFQFPFFGVIPCITTITVEITTHRGADEDGSRRIKPCLLGKLFSPIRPF
jgi:hypothetical protein